MQSLTFVSDLHIDYNNSANRFIRAYQDYAGYLIIAGDFAEVRDKDSIFFRTFEGLFEVNSNIYVIFVCGNHEYYGGSIQGVHDLINEWVEEKDMDRFFFLHEDLEQLYINDTLFVGSTLWYPDTNPDVYLLQNNINDFSEIQGFTPQVAAEQNQKIKQSLDREPMGKEIWIFHHLPSYQSVSSNFRGDRLNCYYVDPEMEKLILDKQPQLVIHGHSHTPCRYQIGSTWVISNPKGYGKQNAQSFDYFKHLIWV
jgi:predicted phosphodiesterase